MNQRKVNNIAFIDGQNLYLGAKNADSSWFIGLSRFFIYLKYKYGVGKAYYFLGYNNSVSSDLYKMIQEAGFILIFKNQNELIESKKKGNVDTDLVFEVMRSLYKGIEGRIVLVSGDGDYKKKVDFLIEENKFEKILFPNQKKSSSLYKDINVKFKSNLSQLGIKNKIGLK